MGRKIFTTSSANFGERGAVGGQAIGAPGARIERGEPGKGNRAREKPAGVRKAARASIFPSRFRFARRAARRRAECGAPSCCADLEFFAPDQAKDVGAMREDDEDGKHDGKKRIKRGPEQKKIEWRQN